jgi:hypothetical protein
VGSNIVSNTSDDDDDGVSGAFRKDVYRFARTKTILDPLWLCRCTVSLDGDVRTRKSYLHGDYTVRTHIIVHHRMQCTISCIASCSLRSTVIRNSEFDFRKAKRQLLKLRFEVPKYCERSVHSTSGVRSQTCSSYSHGGD